MRFGGKARYLQADQRRTRGNVASAPPARPRQLIRCNLPGEAQIGDGNTQRRQQQSAMRDRVHGHGRLGHGGRKFMAPIGTFAVLILVSNLLGLVPGCMPPTGNIIVTLSLALCSFVTYNFYGIRAQGLGYIKHFMGPILVMAPLFFPIEVVSHIARPMSLAIRLFGNIFGDHQVSGVFLHLVPFAVPVPFILLGIFVAFVQTLVFCLLSMIYISQAVEHH